MASLAALFAASGFGPGLAAAAPTKGRTSSLGAVKPRTPSSAFLARQRNKRRFLEGFPIPEADRAALERSASIQAAKAERRAYADRRAFEGRIVAHAEILARGAVRTRELAGHPDAWDCPENEVACDLHYAFSVSRDRIGIPLI